MVASRFQKNVAIHPAHPQADSFLHPHLHPNAGPEHNNFYPPVARPESANPWHGSTVERNIKATSDSQSIAARLQQPASGVTDQPESYLPYGAETNSEAERITAEWIAAKAGKSASYRLDQGIDRSEPAAGINEDEQYNQHPTAYFSSENDQASPATTYSRTPFHHLPEKGFDDEESDDFDSVDSDDRQQFAMPSSPFANAHMQTKAVTTENKPMAYSGRVSKQPAEQTSAPKSKTASTPALETDLRVASPLQPVWEVDDFTWPAIVAKLLETQEESVRRDWIASPTRSRERIASCLGYQWRTWCRSIHGFDVSCQSNR